MIKKANLGSQNHWSDLPLENLQKFTQLQVDTLWDTLMDNDDVEGLKLLLSQNFIPSPHCPDRKWSWVTESFIQNHEKIFDWFMYSEQFKKQLIRDLKNTEALDYLVGQCDLSDYSERDKDKDYQEAWTLIKKVWPIVMDNKNIIFNKKGQTFGGLLVDNYFMDIKGKKWMDLLKLPEMGKVLSSKNKKGLTVLEVIEKNKINYRNPFGVAVFDTEFKNQFQKIENTVLMARLNDLPVGSSLKLKKRI